MYNKSQLEVKIRLSLTSEGGVLKLLKSIYKSWVLVGSQLQISSKLNVIMHIDLVVKCDHAHQSRTSNTPKKHSLSTNICKQLTHKTHDLLHYYNTNTVHKQPIAQESKKLKTKLFETCGGGTLNDHT